MPARTAYEPGTPSWTDLMTPDPAAAKVFYTSLFGWDYVDEDTGMPDNPYIMASKNGKSVAGMGRQFDEEKAQGIPPHWNTYVTVSDVDAATAKAKGLGASAFMEPMDVMDAGRMAVLADPAGAVFSLWQAKQHIGAELVNEHGTLTWNELITPDVDAAAKFYGDLFGWKAQTDDVGGGMMYTAFMLGDRTIGGAMKPPMDGIPPNWGVYFAVDDTDATVATATKGGASVIMEPNDIPPGRMAVLTDPQGAVFSVLALAQPGD
jgi:predicted enzyme related to lactoylglutathione lyase